jgi:hypothetical protein
MQFYIHTFLCLLSRNDGLCSLMVRYPGYGSRGQGSIPDANQIFWEVVGLERGPLSLVSTIEELLGRKSSASGLERENTTIGIRQFDHVASSIPKSLH